MIRRTSADANYLNAAINATYYESLLAAQSVVDTTAAHLLINFADEVVSEKMRAAYYSDAAKLEEFKGGSFLEYTGEELEARWENIKYSVTRSPERNRLILPDGVKYYSSILKTLGVAGANFKNVMLVKALESTALGPDGKAIFADDHPYYPVGAAASTQDNLYASTPLSLTNVETVYNAMLDRKNAAGVAGDYVPTHVFVSPAKKLDVSKILAAVNPVDQSKANPIAAELTYVVVGGLATSTTWYMAALGSGAKPFFGSILEEPHLLEIADAFMDPVVIAKNKVPITVFGQGGVGIGPWEFISKCTA